MTQVVIKKNPVFDIVNGDLSFDIPQSIYSDSHSHFIWQPSEIRSFLKRNLSEFQKNTVYVKDSFISAIKQSETAIRSAIDKDADYMYGHLKYKTGVCLGDSCITTFYSIDTESQSITYLVTILNIPVFGVVKQSIKAGVMLEGAKTYLSKDFQEHQQNREMIDELNTIGYFSLMTAFFRTYSDHEIKIVPYKASAKINGTEFKNMNKANVLILDSSWYTSLVKTEGFMVRGHLRMQPHGPSLSERKLIYIDSFEKHGYVRKAKMLPKETPGISEILTKTAVV